MEKSVLKRGKMIVSLLCECSWAGCSYVVGIV